MTSFLFPGWSRLWELEFNASFKMLKNLKLMASGDACKFLNIKRGRLAFLVKKYKIPHHKTSSGFIFEKEDLAAFQNARKENLKYRKNK